MVEEVRSRDLWPAALVLAAYYAGGRIGLAVPFTSGNVSPVWPSSGIALAAVLLAGPRVWPAIAAAAFLVNFFSPIPPLAALGIAFGNAAGPLVGAWLLRRFVGFDTHLTRLRDVIGLVVFGALAGTAISATAGTAALFLTHVNAWSGTGAAWLIWWLGDGMGVLVVAPLILAARGVAAPRTWRGLVEMALLVAGAVATSALIFGRLSGGGAHDILVLALFPFVMWGAIRFEAAGAAPVTFLVSAIAVWDTAFGRGPFVNGTRLENAVLLQSFLAVVGVSGLSVAALISERTRLITERSEREAAERGEAERRLTRDSILLLSRAVEQTADSVVVTDRRGVIEYVNPAFEETTGYPWEDAVGRTPAILKSGQHGPDFYRDMWHQIVEGHPFRGTLVNRKRGGALYWAEQTITPVRDQEGEITHFVSVLKDVTELRRKQEQEVQLRLARAVQQQFYREPIPLPGLDLAAASYPANETGGDYFDFIPIGRGALYVAIGDASGHGLASALVMTLTRAYVRAFAAMHLEVGEILTRVNAMLASDLEENRYVTLLLARVDAGARTLSYANAGHVSGLLVDGRRGVESVMASTGPPVGVFAGTDFRTCDLPFEASRMMLLVTDGVTESVATGDDEFGPDRLVSYACANCERPARQIADGICQAARSFSGDEPQADDITSVVVKVEA